MMFRPLHKPTLLATLVAASILVAWASETPLDTPQYFGEIKRNERGELVAVPKTEAIPTQTDIPSQLANPAKTTPIPPTEAKSPTLPTKTVNQRPAASKPLPADLPATEVRSKVHRVGPTHALRTIAAAAAIAQNGDTIEIEPGDYVADVAIWTQDRLTLRGVGGKPRLVAGGKSAEGKAIWVIRGGQITIENIIFTGAKVPDLNGAGIRFEKGYLIIRNCAFLNNEDGILTAGGNSELVIENSEFGHNGFGDGQSHALYVGAIKRLQVTGSYFHHNNEGHLIKSRAAVNHIMYNRLTDENGGTASYELEFPSGGVAYVVGNIIQQSATTSNSTIISYGMEGYTWPTNELYLNHNTIVDDRAQGGIFLNFKPGVQKVQATNNLLVGTGDLTSRPLAGLRQKAIELAKRSLSDAPEPPPAPAQTGQIRLTNNITTDWSSFAQASRFDYRIKDEARAKTKVVDAGSAHGFSLQLQREYVHPASSKALTTPATVPGAIQSRPVGIQ